MTGNTQPLGDEYGSMMWDVKSDLAIFFGWGWEWYWGQIKYRKLKGYRDIYFFGFYLGMSAPWLEYRAEL